MRLRKKFFTIFKAQNDLSAVHFETGKVDKINRRILMFCIRSVWYDIESFQWRCWATSGGVPATDRIHSLTSSSEPSFELYIQ